MGKTLFASVYNRFLNKITDDMYMELTPQDTIHDLQNLLINAIPGFEFPRKSLDYELVVGDCGEGFVIPSLDGTSFVVDGSYFRNELTSEEINILAILMQIGWIQRQVSSIEHVRMKYGGTDFKLTSQANHLAKLLALLEEARRESHHMQRLYKRRKKDEDGNIRSNWSVFRTNPSLRPYEGGGSGGGSGDQIEEVIYDGGQL